ncbi:anamorsin homolog [Battus philenor]|uniref:anamorsin homolog n=1 Tax=Battus philenor TaxID=42288 RepID=UPI0035D12F15
MEFLKKGDCVLIISNHSKENDITNFVNDTKTFTVNGNVFHEDSSNINDSFCPKSPLDVVLSNFIPPHSVAHNDNLLAKFLKILKPSGRLILKDELDITSALKLNGFVNVTKGADNLYTADKPNFEVGSKVSLKLGQKPAVWKLDDTVEEVWSGANDDDIIDADQLLDEDDLKKPDKQSLRVCSTTGKRKACADCSCGLAEELRGETKDTPKSSCGSCYLGDAFRCATCPYLGMPAFKPGEKVMLDLNSDI